MLRDFVIFALTLVAPPGEAVNVAARVVGVPVEPLLRICHRESVGPSTSWRAGPCAAVKVHAIDAGHHAAVWRKAAAVGWLDPTCQDVEEPGGWSTRGMFGLIAAYHARFLPRCFPAWAFDVPLVSAYVAAKKLKAHCETSAPRRHPANVRWAGSDACAWNGSGSTVWRQARDARSVQLTAHPARGQTSRDATHPENTEPARSTDENDRHTRGRKAERRRAEFDIRRRIRAGEFDDGPVRDPRVDFRKLED